MDFSVALILDVEATCYVDEDSKRGERTRRFLELCREAGFPVKVGRWRIPGRPRTILVEFSKLLQRKDELLAELWTKHDVDSLFGAWEYVEPVLFGHAAGRVVDLWWRHYLAGRVQPTVAQFHEDHGREHNYSRPDAPVEIYRLTVTATGLTRKAEFAQHDRDTSSPEPASKRNVIFDEDLNPIMTPIYDRDSLKAGAVVEGPAIIEQLDSTILVPPGLKAEVDPSLTIVINVPLAQG